MLDTDRNRLIAIDGELHRVLAHLDRLLLLAHVATGRVYLVQGEDGAIGLPDAGHLLALEAAGRAASVAVPSGGVSAPSDAERLGVQIAMLDEAGVANGSKAILLFMLRSWGRDLRDRYGEHDHPDTLKRIRTAKRKALRT